MKLRIAKKVMNAAEEDRHRGVTFQRSNRRWKKTATSKAADELWGELMVARRTQMLLEDLETCDSGYYDDDWDDDEDELERSYDECGYAPMLGSCTLGGTEYCDFDCILREHFEAEKKATS